MFVSPFRPVVRFAADIRTEEGALLDQVKQYLREDFTGAPKQGFAEMAVNEYYEAAGTAFQEFEADASLDPVSAYEQKLLPIARKLLQSFRQYGQIKASDALIETIAKRLAEDEASTAY